MPTVTIDVEVDPQDVLDELSVKERAELLAEFGGHLDDYETSAVEVIQRCYDLLRDGDEAGVIEHLKSTMWDTIGKVAP